MDSLTANITSIKLDTLPTRSRQLLEQLQQSGLFRALVIESQGSRVLLDTAFGRLTGQAPQLLSRGDVIMARLLPANSEPTIKIEQHFPRQLEIKSAAIQKLFDTNQQRPVLATVSSQDSKNTQLQIGNRVISIPRQPLLQDGEQLILSPLKSTNIQATRIEAQQILKKVLSQLIPRTGDSSSTQNLNQLQKLSQQLLNIKSENLRPVTTQPAAPAAQASPQSIQRLAPAPVNTAKPDMSALGIGKQPVPLAPAKAAPAVPTSQTLQTSLSTPQSVLLNQQNLRIDGQQPVIKARTAEQNLLKPEVLIKLLGQLAKPVTGNEVRHPNQVHEMMQWFGLVKPGLSGSGIEKQGLSEVLHRLANWLRQSPEKAELMIQNLIRQQIVTAKAPVTQSPEAAIQDSATSFRQELSQQVETTLSQLILQKTSVRMQIEQNLLIQFSLSVPVQVSEQTRELKLKLQQKQRREDPEDDAWEIELSFEFGLLGLITTRVLLQGHKISAHFWAVKPQTHDLINDQLGDFSEQLKRSGFELGRLQCFIGQPVKDKSGAPPLTENLVDIKV